MSFEFSIGDFILLTQLAREAVRGARNACGAHDDLVREVESPHIVLQRFETEVSKPVSILNHLEDSQRRELSTLAGHCRGVLRVLSFILDKYNALSEDRKSVTKLWQKIQFGNGEMQDLVKIRSEIATHTQALNMFLNLVSIRAQGQMKEPLDLYGDGLQDIKQSLHWVIASMQAEAHGEKSILTTYTEDDKGVWKAFRRELIKEGFSHHTLSKHKRMIKKYIMELGERGVLDDHSDIGDREILASASETSSRELSSPPSPTSSTTNNEAENHSGSSFRSGINNSVDDADYYPHTRSCPANHALSHPEEPTIARVHESERSATVGSLTSDDITFLGLPAQGKAIFEELEELSNITEEAVPKAPSELNRRRHKSSKHSGSHSYRVAYVTAPSSQNSLPKKENPPPSSVVRPAHRDRDVSPQNSPSTKKRFPRSNTHGDLHSPRKNANNLPHPSFNSKSVKALSHNQSDSLLAGLFQAFNSRETHEKWSI